MCMSPEKRVQPAKRAQGHSRWSRQSLSIRGGIKSSPLLLPHQAPICPLGLVRQGAKQGGGERGHFQLNTTEGWNEAKVKEEKTKRDGWGEKDE